MSDSTENDILDCTDMVYCILEDDDSLNKNVDGVHFHMEYYWSLYYSLDRVELVVEEVGDDSNLDSCIDTAEEDTPGTDMNMKNLPQTVAAAAAADDRKEIQMAAAPRR